MTKGFLNVLVCLLCSVTISAQVEVVPLQDDEVARFDNINSKSLTKIAERKIPDSLLKALKVDDAFWYASAQPAMKKATPAKEKASTAWLQQQWVRIMFWVLFVGGFAAVLIWYLSSLNIKLFRKPSTAITTLPVTGITEDIFSIAYEIEIYKAVQAQNFRQAVRLYYLQTLSLLSKKGSIQFQQDRTNSEYLMQLYNTAAYNDFRWLTHSFEYTCYGKFNLAPTAFEKVQKDFETFYLRHLS